jgi:hypothetical protein
MSWFRSKYSKDVRESIARKYDSACSEIIYGSYKIEVKDKTTYFYTPSDSEAVKIRNALESKFDMIVIPNLSGDP